MFDDDIDDLPILPLHAKPEFKPQYLKSDEKQDNDKERLNAINAVIEIIALWEYVKKEALHNYSSIYSKISIPLSYRFKQTCQSHKENFAIYDVATGAWLMKPSEPYNYYNYCYDGYDFVDFLDAKNEKTSRFLLVGKYTTIMQEPKLLEATAVASSCVSELRLPSIKLIVGVPGCGKTSHIINHHSKGSLVLTSGKEGAQDIRTRMAEKDGGGPYHYSWSYRTIDSYLLNSRDMYSYVWVDEALMEHPGKLFLVSLFSFCRQLYLLGDPNQLGYINRTEVPLRYDKSSMFFKPTATLNISYRCPVDVMAVLPKSYDYDGGAYSTSNVLRSLKSKTFTSLKDLPISEGTKYLVFKQAEKKQMKAAGYDVSTVHEYQGKQAAHVVLVRMSRNLMESLYESTQHMLVAISRHTESFVYYTPVNDILKRTIDVVFTDVQLKKHQKILDVNKEQDKATRLLAGLIIKSCLPTPQQTQPQPSPVHATQTQLYNKSLTDANDPQLTLSLPFQTSNDEDHGIHDRTSKVAYLSSKYSYSPTNTYLHSGNFYSGKEIVPFNPENFLNISNETVDSTFDDEPTILRPIVRITFMFIFIYVLDRIISQIVRIVFAFVLIFMLKRIISSLFYHCYFIDFNA